jgi:pimeloyl-ACP methyl ester carboxylesterase
MSGITRTLLSDARGVGTLLIEASAQAVDVVERMHRTVQVRPAAIGESVTDATRGITGFVYQSIRGSMRLVGRGVDTALESVEPLLPEGESSPGREAFISIVNGIYGDTLARTGNPLAIGMSLSHACGPLDVENPAALFEAHDGVAPTGKLLVLVHGLCMSVHQWTHDGYNHGEALARSLGYTSLYLRYNSGLPIAENGRLFAEYLEALVAHWPRRIDELTIIGHSMGGLVARSACHAGEELDHGWRRSLSRLVFLGTPHHGAPLERGGHGLDYLLEISPYSAPFTTFGKARSAGIQDLRHGTITSDGHHAVPLPRDVACYAIAAALGEGPGALDRVVGDGLVPLDSALGRHRNRARTLRIPQAHQWVGHGMGHLALLHRPEVFAQLEKWLRTPVAAG